MWITRARGWYQSLNKFDSVVFMTIISILELLMYRLPTVEYFHGIFFEEVFQYLYISGLALVVLVVLQPPTISTFGWPSISWKSLLALLFAVPPLWLNMVDGWVIHQPDRVKVAGIAFLLSIGITEELVSRALIFGTFQRFGMRFAVITSAFMFGLTHLNLYIHNWSYWRAFGHVMNATSFGLFVCALYIATKSFWVIAIFHALCDWGVVFDQVYGGTSTPVSFYEGLQYGLIDFIFPYGFSALVLLYILRGRWPRWFKYLCVRLSYRVRSLVKRA